MYSSRIAICPVAASNSVTQRVHIAIIRALPTIALILVVGIAQIACGSQEQPKEFVRQDLSIIKPEKCDGGRHRTSCGGFQHRDTKKG